MAEKNDNNGKSDVRQLLLGGTRKLFLASLGAVMMTQDELGHMVEKFVERGESAKERSQKRIDDFVADRRKQAKNNGKRAEKEFDQRVERFLHRMNIPTRSEIKSLNTKITRLNKKVDELK